MRIERHTTRKQLKLGKEARWETFDFNSSANEMLTICLKALYRGSCAMQDTPSPYQMRIAAYKLHWLQPVTNNITSFML